MSRDRQNYMPEYIREKRKDPEFEEKKWTKRKEGDTIQSSKNKKGTA